ncbi:HD-GYP domain-containing protein [Lachnospiraceae bacterium JC7]|nr:HD-GYP domain-containing protein [Lachnospiraceae bacterium JC7]
MRDFIAAHQLNIMLMMGSICGTTALFSAVSNVLSRRRKMVMIGMEISAMLLLFSDRFAYIYRGRMGSLAIVMTRLSNFLVYSTTIGVVYFVNQYIEDLCVNEGGDESVPELLLFTDRCALLAQILVVISQFTGLYYTFDATNHYVRSQGFIISYLLPVVIAIIQLYVLLQYTDRLSRRVLIPLILFSVTPLIAGGLQIVFYGLSLTNMTMVGEIIVVYIFTLMDTNERLAQAHEIEMDNLRKEKMSMKRLFDEAAKAFVAAIERKDTFLQGHSSRIADIARTLAKQSGKSEEECDRVYYSALLHDIGLILLPDSLVGKAQGLNDMDYKLVKKTPVFSEEILSSIKEYPYLSESARHSYERYDGKGYPDGLSGEDIPEISRIIAVARAYDAMVSKRRYRDPLPMQVVREELIKGSGTQFDSRYSDLMVQLIDTENAANEAEGQQLDLEKEIRCGTYREKITAGIPIMNDESIIRFRCEPDPENSGSYSTPSLIIFDAFDRHVHDNRKSIEANHYLEYGEVWFDGHGITTAARNMDVTEIAAGPRDANVYTGARNSSVNGMRESGMYEILCGRYEDHLKLRMKGPYKTVDVIVALPNKSMASYIALTGENCRIFDIDVKTTFRKVGMGDIPRIAEEISYIDRIEADIPNIQVDRTRSVATEGIEVKDGLEIKFHSRSLPTASLVWECPYMVLFYSDDRKVRGRGYREYALIKLNGENDNRDEYAENRFSVKRTAEFEGWDRWKQSNKDGLVYDVYFAKKRDKVTLMAENYGIHIKNITHIRDGRKKVYAAITGDQVALTDIRVL